MSNCFNCFDQSSSADIKHDTESGLYSSEMTFSIVGQYNKWDILKHTQTKKKEMCIFKLNFVENRGISLYSSPSNMKSDCFFVCLCKWRGNSPGHMVVVAGQRQATEWVMFLQKKKDRKRKKNKNLFKKRGFSPDTCHISFDTLIFMQQK